MQAQLSYGNVPLKSRRNTIEKGLRDLEQWAGLSDWERSAVRKERCRDPSPFPRGTHLPPILDLASWLTPPSRDAPAGRLYRPGGGASEATWTLPRPYRIFKGPTRYRISFGFERLEYLSREAGAHLS